MDEHIHTALLPVCPCGHRWEIRWCWTWDQHTYGMKADLERFRTLYGEPMTKVEEAFRKMGIPNSAKLLTKDSNLLLSFTGRG